MLDITKTNLNLMGMSTNHPNENKGCFIQFAMARGPASITCLWWRLKMVRGVGKVSVKKRNIFM